MSNITIRGAMPMSMLCDAAEAMNCHISYDATVGVIMTVRAQEPMYHNLTDAELLRVADQFESLYIVRHLAARLESAQECRRELEEAEARIAELDGNEATIAEHEARIRELEASLADCEATISEFKSN